MFPRITNEYLVFIKATVHAFAISITCTLFNVDWLANFQSWANLIVLLEFHIALSEILLKACADQLLYNLSLIKSYSACAKQNGVVKTASDACSLLAK